MQGLGISGFGDLSVRVSDEGSRVYGLGFRFRGLCSGLWGVYIRLRVLGLRFEVEVSGFAILA